MPSAALIPELVHLAGRVMDVVEDVRGRVEQTTTGSDVEAAAAAGRRADDILTDVVRETRTLVVAEMTARNKLSYALADAQAEEKEFRETARAIDRRRTGDPEAINYMSRAQSKRRDVEQLATELADADARVSQTEAFYESALATQEDLSRTVAALRRRYAAAERLAALNELSGRVQQRIAGVAELRSQVNDAVAATEAERSAAALDRGTSGFLGRGRLGREEAAEELARYRDGK